MDIDFSLYSYVLLMVVLIAMLIAIIVINFVDTEANHNELWIGLQIANLCMSGVFGGIYIYMNWQTDVNWQSAYIGAMFGMLLLSSLYSILCIQYHERNALPSMSELMALQATNPPVVTTPLIANHLYAMIVAIVALALGMLFTVGMDMRDARNNAHHRRTYMVLSLVVPLVCLLNVTGRSPGESGVGVNSAFLCQFSSPCPLSLQL